MIIKIYNYLAIASIFAAIIGLYTIKDKVSSLNYQVEQINSQINLERDNIHILKAEFAYLSAPNRIRELSSNYLDLHAIKTSQMIADPIVIEEQNTKISSGPDINNTRPVKNIKWRYKKITNRYIQNVSKK